NVYAMLLGKSQTVFMSLFYAAQCLTCNLCVFGSSGTCSNEGNVTCDNRTSSCFNAQASKLTHSTCLIVKCCNTDLCNGASSLQLPLIVTLCFGTLTSLWVMT
uniref:UPAR/Ly6 domain-containing protein n=1 Tax=Takifugu rubripes TaxID=31033 RepID=A0A3B5K4Q0_TAKRU